MLLLGKVFHRLKCLLGFVAGKTVVNVSTLFFYLSLLCFLHFISDLLVDLIVFSFFFSSVPVFLQTSLGVTHVKDLICDQWFCFLLAPPKDLICCLSQCFSEIVDDGFEVFI